MTTSWLGSGLIVAHRTIYPRPMSDDRLSASERAIVDAAIELAATVIDPNADRWETERVFAVEAFAAAAQAGLTAVIVPEEFGGRGAGEVTLARMMEELAAADLAAAFSLVVHNNMARAVAGSGNAHLIDTVLPVLISGERLGAFLLTEPGVGSDAAAITCSADLDGESWVIRGEKAWVTNASEAGLLNVYAQTDPSRGYRGIVSIVVDTELPGVVRGPAYELMGAHAMGTGGFEFSDVRVGVENTLIPVGEAFGAAMVGIDLARVLVAAMCCGMMRRSLDTAIAVTGERQIFGGSVSDKQGVQWMLADVATDLAAARLLTYRAARLLQEGGDATVVAAHAKKFAARKAPERIADCMQVMGAVGYRRANGNPLPRHLAASRITGYIDGATEIQNVVIARDLWKEHRPR